MAGYFTYYANNISLDLFFGHSSFSPPVTLYAGLSITNAAKNGFTIEPSGGSYARVAITNNLTAFPAAVSGSKANATAITFPTPTGNWGEVLSIFFSDASSGGNIIAMIDLATPVNITSSSSTPVVAIGSLNFANT